MCEVYKGEGVRVECKGGGESAWRGRGELVQA